MCSSAAPHRRVASRNRRATSKMLKALLFAGLAYAAAICMKQEDMLRQQVLKDKMCSHDKCMNLTKADRQSTCTYLCEEGGGCCAHTVGDSCASSRILKPIEGCPDTPPKMQSSCQTEGLQCKYDSDMYILGTQTTVMHTVTVPIKGPTK